MTDKTTQKAAIESAKDTLLDAKLMVKLIAQAGNHLAFDDSDYNASDIGLGIEASAKAVCEKLEWVLEFLDKLDRTMPEQKEIEAAA